MSAAAQPDDREPGKLDRLQLRKAVDRLGWKWVNRTTVAIRADRELRVGGRTVVLRGRVEVPTPDPMTADAGERAAAAVADPAVAGLRERVERAAARLLAAPDEAVTREVFERSSLADALWDAERALVQSYQELADRRLDDAVEAELGIPFYLAGLATAERTFEYFVGPTNSGKTHAALEILGAAERGVYLAPLRLLALEIYERLNDMGIATSLVTGEERLLRERARHVSSTVEMADLRAALDVAVVDEAQMLEDAQRGWAWTLAVAGVRAQRVVLCGSEEGLRAAQQLVERLGATLTVRRFERKNPLRVVPAVGLSALRPRDAVVAFSRKAVVDIQRNIAAAGYTSAAIYGSLSPVVRRREAERFRSGQADILVATDAIGLGLNLPIRRIVFAALEKWDGSVLRPLTTREIRQIAGRAGRYGIHEEGQVTALDADDVPLLRKSIESTAPAHTDSPIWIAPTDEHLRRLGTIIGTTRVSRLLRFFQTRVLQRGDVGLRIADLTDQIDVAFALEASDAFMRLPFEVRCAYSRAPVTNREAPLRVLLSWAEQHAAGATVDGAELLSAGGTRDRVLLFEDRSRIATLYLWLAQRFPDTYTNRSSITSIRETIDDEVQSALLQRGARSKKQRVPKRPNRRGPAPRKFR